MLDAPTEGEVIICGQPTSKLSESERADVRLTKCGFVFQFHFLLPEFTSLQNVLLPMRAAGKMSETEMRERISLFERRDVQAHVLVVLFPSDLMLVARGLCGEKYSLSY